MDGLPPLELSMSAEVRARWGHRVDGLIHTHGWTVEATLAGSTDCERIFPVDELEAVLKRAVAPWEGRYLTTDDLGPWRGFDPLVIDHEPTVEELARRLWLRLDDDLPGLVALRLVESTEFDRSRSVTLRRH